jgi:hypothetical protein
MSIRNDNEVHHNDIIIIQHFRGGFLSSKIWFEREPEVFCCPEDSELDAYSTWIILSANNTPGRIKYDDHVILVHKASGKTLCYWPDKISPTSNEAFVSCVAQEHANGSNIWQIRGNSEAYVSRDEFFDLVHGSNALQKGKAYLRAHNDTLFSPSCETIQMAVTRYQVDDIWSSISNEMKWKIAGRSRRMQKVPLHYYGAIKLINRNSRVYHSAFNQNEWVIIPRNPLTQGTISFYEPFILCLTSTCPEEQQNDDACWVFENDNFSLDHVKTNEIVKLRSFVGTNYLNNNNFRSDNWIVTEFVSRSWVNYQALVHSKILKQQLCDIEINILIY